VSKGPENTFIASVHKHLPFDLYRIKNNNTYNAGQPDVWYSGPRADLWIEYKFIVVPKHPGTPIKIELSELQKNWLKSRHAEGRRVAVVVGSKAGGALFMGDSWDKHLTSGDFLKLVLPRSALADAIALICTGG
jgi:hypothetical protein